MADIIVEELYKIERLGVVFQKILLALDGVTTKRLQC